MGVFGYSFQQIRRKSISPLVLFGTLFVMVFSLLFFFGVGALLDNRLYHTYPITFVDYDHFLLWAM
ncbi:hypothetical protein HYS48_02255, partial [Candidatus Woesearchaeota archaeon]|nr:hypothetical protein [Candidatus Woesearchaeota archaeon]